MAKENVSLNLVLFYRGKHSTVSEHSSNWYAVIGTVQGGMVFQILPSLISHKTFQMLKNLILSNLLMTSLVFPDTLILDRQFPRQHTKHILITRK